jgi:hypothetical protein
MNEQLVLDYAGPEIRKRRQRRRTGAMGLFLGLAWIPSEMVYHSTPTGRVYSGLVFVATVGLILLAHWVFTRRRNRFDHHAR